MKNFHFVVSRLAAVLVLLSWPLPAQSPPRGVGSRPTTAPTARRIALVLGNSKYQEGPLANPVNDANGMAAVLSEFGFEVIKGLDLDKRDMLQRIREFGDKMQAGGVGLFFFAGHGLQVKGLNYLVPLGATITKDTEVEFEAIEVGFVLAQMEAASNQVNIVILDACRNNPFARSFRSGGRGLAPVDAPKGSIIAYATAPGSVASDGPGNNGLYTGALLKHLRVPGRSLEEIFSATRDEVMRKTKDAQVPWEATSLRGRFVFSGEASATSNVPGLSPEAAEWQVVRNSPEITDVQEFLQRFPNGQFATAARLYLKQLQTAAAAVSETAPPTNTNNATLFGQPQTDNVTLAVNRGWVATGMQVKQGQRVELRANGNYKLGRLGEAGPDGVAADDPGKPLPSCTTGALLARIGNQVTCVRQNKRFLATETGELFLTVNVSNSQKNTGTTNVDVTIASPLRPQ